MYVSSDILQTSFLILNTIWGGLLSDIARIVFLLERKTIASTFNTLIAANKSANKNVSIFKDYSGWLLVYLQLGMWIFGTSYPFAVRFKEMDPWLVIFQELGLHVSGTQSSWFLWMLSFLMTALQDICIFQRDMVVEMLICFAFLLSGEAHMSSILKTTKSHPDRIGGLKAYINLMIIFKRLTIFLSYIAGCYVLFGLLMSTMFCWIAVNCYGIVPLVMVAMSAAAFIGGLGIAVILIGSLGNLRTKSVELIKGNRKRYFNGNGGDWNGYMKRMWIAQHPLPINCGGRFAFSKDALMTYMTVLSDMITNSLLLIKVQCLC